DRRAHLAAWKEEEAQFLSQRAKAREIEAGLGEEDALRGELADLERKLNVFEASGHADILKSFQRRRRQLQAIESWENGLASSSERLRAKAAEVMPALLDPTTFDMTSGEDAELVRQAGETRNRFTSVGTALEEQAKAT